MSDGPLTAKVLDFTRTMEGLVADGEAPDGWAALTVFDFDEHGKIRRLNVYLQQGREG